MTRYLQNQTSPQPPQRLRRRSGTTISEVLISMVIMGIGVVSLATLFPASVLRSIQASQLTNAALLSKNAKARIVYDKLLLSNPLNNNVNDPDYVPLTTGLDPTTPPSIGIIDPFGTHYGLGNIAGGNLVRRSGGSNNQLMAENLGMLPDSWSMVRQDSVTGGYSTNSYNLTAAAPASNFVDITPRNVANPLNPLYRLTILDATGKFGLRRTLRQVLNGNQLSWENTDGTHELDLPSGFIPARCRIEVRDNRYTWMLTVRKRPLDSSYTAWKAEVDLVVFFNRSFKAADELPIQMSTLSSGYGFDGAPGFAGVDDDTDGFTDWTNPPTNSAADADESRSPGSDDNRTLTFIGTAPPLLKKGAYLLETSQARWYRIINIDIKNSLVLLDRDLVELPANPINFVLIKGIVQVFELGTFSGAQ